MILALLLACDPPKPDPADPCRDWVVSVPHPGWGAVACPRADQTATVVDGVLLCTCKEPK